MGTNRKTLVTIFAALALSFGAGPALTEQAEDSPTTQPIRSSTKSPAEANRRHIRVAVFDFDVLKGVDVEPAALTDQINTMLSMLDKVTIVNRDQIKKVADEHSIALSGLVDSSTAVKMGKFLSAQYIIVGRASRIAQTNYLVTKIIDVQTTVQHTVSAKAAVESGVGKLLERLDTPLTKRIRKLQKPVVDPEDVHTARLLKLAKPLAGKVVLVTVSERHVNRPLSDPAAQMAIANRLRRLGLKVIVPKNPVRGWEEGLLQTGKYGESKVDYLLEGEGVSAYATRLLNLISCRARVELRLVPVPGRKVTHSEKGVGAKVDLVEDLAAKAALEDAGLNACDDIVEALARELAKDAEAAKPAKR